MLDREVAIGWTFTIDTSWIPICEDMPGYDRIKGDFYAGITPFDIKHFFAHTEDYWEGITKEMCHGYCLVARDDANKDQTYEAAYQEFKDVVLGRKNGNLNS